MTDIKIKIGRYADKENLKKLMKYLKNTFVNKIEIKELVDGKPISLKIDLVRFVSTLPELDAAEEGVIYFVPTDIAGEYDLYAKETVDGVAKFVKNSSLHISGDLDDFLLKADANKKYISTASVTDDTITLFRPDGSTVVITVNNVAHATKADQDGNGHVITSTYATKTELASKANTSDLSTVATSGDYNDLSNKPVLPQINVDARDGSWVVSRDTDGNFFRFIHTQWSRSINNAWAGMYFEASDGTNVFGFAARQTSSQGILPGEPDFTKGNNGYLRGYDTNGRRSVTLVINGGTAGEPDTQNITVDGTFVNKGNQYPLSKNTYTIGTSDMPYQAMYAGAFNTDNPSGDSGLTASKSSTKHSLLFGIGNTGVNRGIYDNKNKRWSVFLDGTDYIMTQCPTPPEGDSSNKLATTEWVQNELAKLRQDLHDLQELVASMAKEKENDQESTSSIQST